MMAKPCRITFLAFIWGDVPKGREHGWTDDDLETGIFWADGMLEDGFEIEPMDDFNIRAYREWCFEKLEKPSSAMDDYMSYRSRAFAPEILSPEAVSTVDVLGKMP